MAANRSGATMEQAGRAEYGPPSHNVGHTAGGSTSSLSPHPAAAAAGPPPFLFKTYEMVDDASTDAAVSWSQSGTTFVVWDPQQFCQQLLPCYFKHSNFSSFIRQLNIYGFRKSDPDRWEFENRNFIRGQRHLLQGIRRRISVVAGARQTGASTSTSSRDYQQEGRVGANVVRHCDAVAQCTTQMQNQLVLVSYGRGSDVLPMNTDSSYTGRGPQIREQSLQEEIQRLKREKSVLMMEVMRLRQQLQRTEQDVQAMWQHLQATEQRQHRMLAFVSRAARLNNQAVLASFMGQEQHQIQGPASEQQIPWQAFNVSSASAQLASPIGSAEIGGRPQLSLPSLASAQLASPNIGSAEIGGRPQLSLPLVRSTDSLTTSETKRTGSQQQLAVKASAKRSSPQEEAITRHTPTHQEDCDLSNRASCSSNSGFHPRSLGSHDDHQISRRAKFDVHHQPDEVKLSQFSRQQLRHISPPLQYSESPSTSGSWLQKNQPQLVPAKPLLVPQDQNRGMSDSVHYARQEHAFTASEHDYSYEIITREVSIGASFLPSRHVAEASGSAQSMNVGDVVMVSASHVQPAEDHIGYKIADVPPGLSDQRESQANRRQHRSAFSSLVRSAQNEQAQFGASFTAASIGGHTTGNAPQAAGRSSRPILLKEEPDQQIKGSNLQALGRLDSIIMSDFDQGFPTTIRSTDFHEFETDTIFWQQLLDSDQITLQEPERETCAAPAASCNSSFQGKRAGDAAAASSSQDEDPPREEWAWNGNPTSQSSASSRSWPHL